MRLECTKCGNKNLFFAFCTYSIAVDGQGEEEVGSEPQLEEGPRYECGKCGAKDVQVHSDVKEARVGR
jgi:ribosomal protein S27AE